MAKKKIQPGKGLNQITAREFNRHVDVADWWERTQRLGGPRQHAQPRPEQLDCVWLKNNTGYDVRQGDAVRPDGCISYGGVDRQYPYFSASAQITSNAYKPWGVALAPIPQGELGRLQLVGAAVCYATISDSIERPFLAPGTSGKLKPSWWGSAEIVYADIATNGERYVLARLGTLQTPIYKARTKATISPGGSGTVGLSRNNVEVDTMTAHLNWMEGTVSIANGTEILIKWFPDESRWVIVNADCG